MEDIDRQKVRERHIARKRLTTQSNTYMGICEVFRMIYDIVYGIKDKETRDQITEKLVDVMIMAKKMNDRLIYYQRTYKDMTGHRANNLIRIPNSGKIAWMRRHRKPL